MNSGKTSFSAKSSADLLLGSDDSGFQTERSPNGVADVSATRDCFLGLGLSCRVPWIAILNGEVSQEDQILAEHTPSWLDRQRETQEFPQVVCFAERNACFLKPSLQVLLGALLSVKASSIVIRVLAGAEQEPGGIPISFRFADPLPGDWLHKRFSHVPKFRG